MKILNHIFIALALMSLITGCGGSPASALTPVPDYWPTEGWCTSTPEEQGMDSEFLNRIAKIMQ